MGRRQPYAAARPARPVNINPFLSGMGKIFGGAIKQQQALNQQQKIDAVANQLMNTANPPRAALVAPGVNPATGRPNVIPAGVPTAGTAPSTGGLAEMRLRQEFQKNQLADAYQKARIANLLNPQGRGRGAGGGAGAGNATRWTQHLSGQGGAGGGGQGGGGGGGKAGKAAPYQPNSIDANTDPRADNFSYIQSDFDAKYGKGAYGKVAQNLANAQPSPDGKSVIIGNPDKPVMTMTPDEAAYWKNRYNAASVAAGHPTIGGLGTGTNANSGQAAGTEVNPVAVKNNLDLRALPYGTWFTGPDGQTHQKMPLAASQGQGQQGGGQQGSGTAGGDQGAADEQAAEEQATQEDAADQAAQDQQGQSQGQLAQGGQGQPQVAQGDQGDQGDQGEEEQPVNAGLVGAQENEGAAPDEDTLNRPEDLWT